MKSSSTQSSGPLSPASLLFICLSMGFVFLGLYFVVHGRFNIDEGLHLNAGRLLFQEGKWLYRDFPFSQGPGGPFLYGAWGAIFGYSIAAGRILSLLINLVGVGLMAWFVRRQSGTLGSLLLMALLLTSFPVLWFMTQVRTEPPSIPLVVASAIALYYRKDGGDSALRWSLAPVLLVWATAFRLTCVVPLLAVCLLVAFDLRRSPRLLVTTAAVVFANGLLAALPMLLVLEPSFFHIVESQAGRAERFGVADYVWWRRFDFLTMPGTGFRGVLLLFVAPLLVMFRAGRGGGEPVGAAAQADGTLARDPDRVRAVYTFIVLGLLCYSPHLFFKIGFFNYALTAIMLFILAISIAVPMWLASWGRYAKGGWALVALLLCIGAIEAGRNLEVWVEPESRTISWFAEIRQEMQTLAPDGCEMLTFETHIAVETACEVTPGLEYSFFSYFPNLGSRAARAKNVLNQKLINAALRTDPPEFVVLTRRAVNLIRSEERFIKVAPQLMTMRGRYTLFREMQVPVGPIYIFWLDVYFYVRSDLLPNAAAPVPRGDLRRADSPARGA